MATADDVTGPVNLGNPQEFTIRELAMQVLAETGAGSALVHEPLPEDDPRQRQPDIRLARELLDWQPRVPLAQGLAHTVRYFRERTGV